MPKFAANLTMLFTELPFMQRFEAAAKAGFEGVEYLFPYPFEKKELAAALRDNGLQQVLHNLPAGDWDKGERGIACHPDRTGEFAEGIGVAIAGVSRELAHKTVVDNLRLAARELEAAGLRLLIEPINTFDIPGFFLTRTEQALVLIEEVGSANLRVQYDIYHAQRMEGELGNTLTKHLAQIGHIQLADNPGRGEPGTGEINYPWLFKHIDSLGYDGWIGCEYKPRATTVEGLGWRQALTQKQ
ncbi:MAG: hydroxypyruvate isomerase family protein [Burkholderiales bacterium]|nr:hydroxypyruvate isomerase family protein [Burkholderiales bacterium]